MGVFMLFVLCSLMGSVVASDDKIMLEPDRPYLKVKLFDTADLECCYKHGPKNVTWIKRYSYSSEIHLVNLSELVSQNHIESDDKQCGFLTLKNVNLGDTGMYQCLLNPKVYTHGTYLQVFRPLEKTINLSESTKNKILTAEGVLLLLCVIIPSASLLFKSKRENKLEMKKMKQEEENIYQGLNLEDCCTTYDQIERSQGQGQYQDVCNTMEEREEILEKP